MHHALHVIAKIAKELHILHVLYTQSTDVLSLDEGLSFSTYVVIHAGLH